MGKIATSLVQRVLIDSMSAEQGKEGKKILRVYDLTKATDSWPDVLDGKLFRSTLQPDRLQTLFCLGNIWIVEEKSISRWPWSRRNRAIPLYFPLTPDRAAIWLVLNGYEERIPQVLKLSAMNVKG